MSAIMKDLNSCLAVSKPTLEEMVNGSVGSYRTRDGSEITVPEEQLRTLWEVCDDQQRITLRIPIYVSTDVACESPAWKVEGRAEAAAIAALLGKRLHKEGFLRLYHPDLKDLRSKIPDCIMIVYNP